MKFLKSTLCIVCLLCLFTPLFAGFTSSKSEINTVAQVKYAENDQLIVLTGHIVKKIGDQSFLFKDDTGEIRVQIDNNIWGNINVTPKTLIKIYGELGNGNLGNVDMVVQKVELVKNRSIRNHRSTNKLNGYQKKLKICHVITRMIVGGAQENTLLSVIGLIEKGHDVTLITGPSPGPEGQLLKQTELTSKYDIKIIKVPHLVRMIDPFRDIMAYHYLKSLFLAEKFDVIHTHSSKAGVIGRAAACSVKTKFIVHTIHGPAFHTYGNPISNWFYKKAEWWAAKRCHAIFAVAQAMIDQSLKANITRSSKF